MQQTDNRGDGAARQGAVQAGCAAQGAARMGMRGPAAVACLCGALLLAACGGGGGGDAALATSVPQSTELATAGNTATNTQPGGTATTSGTEGGASTTEPSGSLPDGYAPDGTLPPAPRSQNARGMTRAMIDEWNATCSDQPTCQIDQAQIDAYNRDVCDAFYPDDAGCYIGQ